MAIIDCKYKQGNICKQRRIPIEEVEKQLQWKCMHDCAWHCMVLTEIDRDRHLSECYRKTKKERKNLEDMAYSMMFSGHDSHDKNDLSSIEYDAYCIHFVLMRKWNYIDDLSFVSAVQNMKKIGFKVPKAVCRKYKSILRRNDWLRKYMDHCKEQELQ